MKQNLQPGEFLKAIPISQVDEAKQEAWGIFTAEVPDSDNEIADYVYQKGKVQSWSDDAKTKAAAAGQGETLGNVRFSHTTLATGKVIALTMDDTAKEIKGGTYLMNVGETKTWDMVANGILQGFSFGGRYDWRKCAECGRDLPLVQGENFCDSCGAPQLVRYGATIAELSICDRPAVPVANILHIKADGSKIHLATEANVEKDEKKTKRVAGEDLAADCFLIVGDKDDTSTWKLPWKFSTDAKTKSHLRNALARFNQLKGVDAETKKKAKAKLLKLCREYGIDVSEEDEKSEGLTLDRSFIKAEVQHIKASLQEKATAAGITLRKDMFDVANMAELLQRIAWLRYSAIQERDFEGDDSELPEMLEQNLIGFSETFLAAAREEVEELIAAAKKAGKVTTMNKEEVQLPSNVQEALTGHVVEMAAHHEVLADAHKAAHEEHKAMAAHHAQHAETHKAIHEHFKKAADDGGDLAEHHAMHADAHKAHHESHLAQKAHHEAKAEHHLAMHKAHAAHAEKCGKLAESFADTPEKKAALATLFKAARDAKPVIVKSATPPPVIDTTKMSATEAQAVEAVKAEYYSSPEFKNKVRAALDAQTTAKLNSVASSAAVVIGVDPNSADIYRVDRPGMSKSNEGDEELTGAEKLFDYIK